MGWLKIDDRFPRNHKILAGDVEVAWFYVCAMSYCAEQMTDGVIAQAAVPVIAPHITDPRTVAERCVEVELLARHEQGYVIPDYLEYNPSRADLVERRRKDAERQAKSRAVSQRDSHGTSDVSPSVPSRPVPKSLSSPPTATTGPVDNPPGGLVDRVVDAVVEARKRGDSKSPGWERTVRRNLRSEADGGWWRRLEELCSEFPDAPVSMLAAAVEGDVSRNLAHYRRAS